MKRKIEKKAPIPERGRGGKNGYRGAYPFPEMSVGDSWLEKPRRGEDAFALGSRISGAAYHYGKRHGMKFVTRREEGGLRVWRVK